MGEIHQIEGARAMNSFQDWRLMMRLNLAPKPMEGIKKTPQIMRSRIGPKILKNNKNEKHCSTT
jgi:hypothetical protein